MQIIEARNIPEITRVVPMYFQVKEMKPGSKKATISKDICKVVGCYVVIFGQIGALKCNIGVVCLEPASMSDVIWSMNRFLLNGRMKKMPQINNSEKWKKRVHLKQMLADGSETFVRLDSLFPDKIGDKKRANIVTGRIRMSPSMKVAFEECKSDFLSATEVQTCVSWQEDAQTGA